METPIEIDTNTMVGDELTPPSLIADKETYTAVSSCGHIVPPLVLLLSKVPEEEDEEVLFDPESPRGDSNSSSSPKTPPTPEHSKFEWPPSSDDQPTDEQGARCVVSSFESFVLTENEAIEQPVTPAAPAELDTVHSRQVNHSVDDGERHSTISSRSSRSSDSDDTDSVTSSAASQPPIRRSSAKLNATIEAVKQKTKQAASHQRGALSRFQVKGGLVGWLHGEGDGGGDNTGQRSSDRNSSTTAEHAATGAGQVDAIATPPNGAPRQRASSLFGNLYDKMKRQQEQLELKLQQLDEPQSRSVASGRAPPPRQRLSLQPGHGINAHNATGVDNSVSTSGTSTSAMRRDSRLRSASSGEVDNRKPKSRLRSLSFASRSAKNLPTGGIDPAPANHSSSSALQFDAFPLEDCLADPKLAAEFINAVLPGDEWLLTLLYSIEEYEALTTGTVVDSSTATATATAEEAVSLETQIMMAITIINRFLGAAQTQPTYPELEQMGKEIRLVVTQYQLPFEILAAGGDDGGVAAQLQATTTLPMTLFDGVYTFVFDKLRDAYDTTFRHTREYTQLLTHRIQQQQQHAMDDERRLGHLVLSFDQVIESEWCCTVFFVYLFRTSHHHRLSFIMDVKFKLRRLYAAAQLVSLPPAEAMQARQRVQHELLLICRRFFHTKLAAVALPTTSPMLVRLKDELCVDALALERSTEPDQALMQRMVDKLDAMRTQTRAEFKRMSFERFASFLTSALYRDFILQPGSASSTRCTRADDLIQLLRVNRISFHQSPVDPPSMRDLRELCSVNSGSEGVAFEKAIATAFAFRGNTVQTDAGGSTEPYSYRALYESPLESQASLQALVKTVEGFLSPECTNSHTSASTTPAPLPPLCFSFLCGTGDMAVHGAVWRFQATEPQPPDGAAPQSSVDNIHGVCVLSRYPLIDGLREYLRAFASECMPSMLDPKLSLHTQDLFMSDVGGNCHAVAQEGFEAHCSRLLCGRNEALLPGKSLPLLDTSVQDLFECLSITHAMRLFSLILQEKKIVMVSSSYSILLSVGEALRSFIHPLVWSHIFVPVLPIAMKGYLHCPTPFIFGLHTSYARHCELPKPSDDLAVVNLDRDSVTGGGDVFLPPLRANALRDRLTMLCKPRIHTRDRISFAADQLPVPFPSDEVRCVFHEELRDMLSHLEAFAFRFECADRTISIVDTSNKSRQWPGDAARFYSCLLQSQAFSSFLGCKN